MIVNFSKKVTGNILIGLDLASKSGYAIVENTQKGLDLVNYGSILIDKNTDEVIRLQNSASALLKCISPYINNKVLITIENCYLGKWNPRTYGFLSRLSGYILSSIMLTHKLKTSNFVLLYPSEAKKLVGLKGTSDKQETVNFINNMVKGIKFELIHNNICDAILLALAGGVYKNGKWIR